MKFFQADSKIKVLSVIYFMVAQSSMMARATSDSFLLKYFQAESIPLMIMGAASLSIVLALLSTYLCERYQAYGAMRMATAGIIITLIVLIPIVFLFGAKGETKPIYVFAYMLCETMVILPMVLFWGMAMGVLNPTESKRWMGLIGAAGTLGCILAGFTISFVSKQEYVNELSLGLNAVVLVVVSIILMVRAKLFTLPDDEEEDSASQEATYSIFKKIGVLISSKQSVLMTWLVVFSAIVLSLIDINFKFEVRKDFSDDLYDFFGQFYTYTSCVQLLLQLFIVRAILTRGGVMAAISILPIILLLVSAGALFLHSREAVYVGKFMTQVVFFTIEYVGLQMLFLSVRKKLRGQMNSAVDGLTRPATIAVISLLITYTLPFWQGGSETEIIYRLNLIIIALCVGWLFVALFNYRFYLDSLLSMVGARLAPYPKPKEKYGNAESFAKKLRELKSTAAEKSDEHLSHEIQNLIKVATVKNLSTLEKRILAIRSPVHQKQTLEALLLRLEETGMVLSKKFSSKIFQQRIARVSFLNSNLSALPPKKRFQDLRSSLTESIAAETKMIKTLLRAFNPQIDFGKLIRYALGENAELKSQSLEVLKGAIGPNRLQLITKSLPTPEPSSSCFNLYALTASCLEYGEWETLLLLIDLIDPGDYAKLKNLLDTCSEHSNVKVRKKALQIIFENERDDTYLLELKNKIANDPDPSVYALANTLNSPSETRK